MIPIAKPFVGSREREAVRAVLTTGTSLGNEVHEVNCLCA
jgi:hypothetical protein